MLLIESSRAAGRALLSGIANYARHHGRWVFFWTAAGLEKAWRGKLSLDVDGVIMRDMELVEDVLAKGLPAVIVGHSREEALERADRSAECIRFDTADVEAFAS